MAREGNAVESWPKGKPFEHLPTFEQLQQRSGMRIAALRVRLRDVKRWRCGDNSVRYDDAEASAALEAEPLPEDLEDLASVVSEPLPQDPVQAALSVMNRSLALFSTVVRERGEITKQLCEIVRTMGEPMKLGQELVRQQTELLVEQKKQSDSSQLEVLVLVRQLVDSKAEREIAAQRAQQTMQFRKETFELAREYVPDALKKFQLVGEAGDALDLLESLDPDAIEPLIEFGFPKEKHEKARKFCAALRKKRAERETVTTEGEPKSEANGAAEKGASP